MSDLQNALDYFGDTGEMPADVVYSKSMLTVLDAARTYAELLENVAKREATHTNYNTRLPCFCDTRFGDGKPGPCVDADEAFAGGPWDGIG